MHADLVIVGGGLVGASLAAAVATHPLTKSLTVVLVDPSPPPHPDPSSWPPLSSPPRTSTITPTSYAFLNDVGAWPLIPDTRVAPVESMLLYDHPDPSDPASGSLPFPSFFSSLSSSSASSTTPGVIRLSASDINQSFLAHVVDNDTLRHALFASLANIAAHPARDLRVVASSVRDIHFPTPSSHSTHSAPDPNSDPDSPDSQWPVITLQDGSVIHARLIAAADGPRSRTRSLLTADWLIYPYHQTAVVANVRVADPASVAVQRFLPTGPLAVLPLAADDAQYDAISSYPNTTTPTHTPIYTHTHSNAATTTKSTPTPAGPLANIVWSTTPAEARALMAADDAAFLDELNVALSGPDSSSSTQTNINTNEQVVLDSSGSLNNNTATMPSPPSCSAVVGKRGSFPLVAGHAPHYVFPHERTVLVGDAAHAVHPLAGQGVNLGFADAAALADCVAAAAATGRDIGGEMGAPLRNYELNRLPANVAAVAGLHALHACFALNYPPARSVRRIGMSIVGELAPVRNMILRFMR